MQENFSKLINNYYIDPIIFSYKFVKACDVCICSGECCYYGVYTDLKEHEKIMAHKDRIIKSMDDSQTKDTTKWFEPEQEDEDFDSGIAVGTELHNGKCVFLDQQGYCTLQKIAMEDGDFKWKYKPLYCILFPLVIYQDKITVDDEHLDRMHYCNKAENQTSTIYAACKDELRFLLGDEGFIELQNYREEYLSQNGLKEKLIAEK